MVNDEHAKEMIINGEYETLFSMDDEKSIKQWQKNAPYSTLLHVISIVNEIMESDKLFFICPTCERKTYTQGFSTGEKGDGGIGLVSTGIVCEDCNTTCDSCSDYSGDLTHCESGSYCEYCFEERLKKYIEKNLTHCEFIELLATGEIKCVPYDESIHTLRTIFNDCKLFTCDIMGEIGLTQYIIECETIDQGIEILQKLYDGHLKVRNVSIIEWSELV